MELDTVRQPSFDVLDPADCYGLLSSTTVGRIAFAGADGLVLRPVNYQVHRGDILLRTSTTGALGELDGYAGEVVFEVDYHASSVRQGWSVIVRGTCATVADQAVLESADFGRLVPWASGPHDLALAVRPSTVTGRRVHVRWPDAGARV